MIWLNFRFKNKRNQRRFKLIAIHSFAKRTKISGQNLVLYFAWKEPTHCIFLPLWPKRIKDLGLKSTGNVYSLFFNLVSRKPQCKKIYSNDLFVFGLSKFQLLVVQLCFKLNLVWEPSLRILSGIIPNFLIFIYFFFFYLNDVRHWEPTLSE